jgi:hypothetical protein
MPLRSNVAESRNVLASAKNPRFQQVANAIIREKVRAVAPSISRSGKLNPRGLSGQSDIRVYTKSPHVIIAIKNLKFPKLGKGRFDWTAMLHYHKTEVLEELQKVRTGMWPTMWCQ